MRLAHSISAEARKGHRHNTVVSDENFITIITSKRKILTILITVIM